MPRFTPPKKLVAIECLVDPLPVERRAIRERAATSHMRETHRRLREASGNVDAAVSQALDAVENALAENPADPDLKILQKSLRRYQQAAEAADELMGTDDDDVTDDDTDDDDDADDDTDDDDDADDDTARESRSLRERRPRVNIDWRAP
jgi:hypothetical protein